jgi:DNA-directed RNA polymerase subunit RPC12/RpoP
MSMSGEIQYVCADCRHRFPISVSEDETETFLREDHSERCPNCGQKVGCGTVACLKCATNFVVEMVHWHVSCTLARDHCPKCGSEYISACIC